MIDFAILSLPRSGSTWAANWLTTDKSFCIHDPLNHIDLNTLKTISVPGKLFGVSCTGLWLFPEWVKENVRRWVILENDEDSVNKSLEQIKMPPIVKEWFDRFKAMPGPRINHKAMFQESTAYEIWEMLFDGEIPFDVLRHDLLVEFQIQPNFDKCTLDPEVMKRVFEQGKYDANQAA